MDGIFFQSVVKLTGLDIDPIFQYLFAKNQHLGCFPEGVLVKILYWDPSSAVRHNGNF
jgi:hypothetical protein